MFVKHCKVEVYLTELKLCEDANMDNVITRRFSKADTIGTFTAPLQTTGSVFHVLRLVLVIIFYCVGRYYHDD